MTLTESGIALAIAATTLAIATPSVLRSRDAYIINSAAHDVATRLYAARVQAITRNQDCRFRVTSTTNYVVECDSGSWNVVENADMPRGLTITANARPEFHRRGNVSPTGTIVLWDGTGRVKRVVVNVNGRVRIQ